MGGIHEEAEGDRGDGMNNIEILKQNVKRYGNESSDISRLEFNADDIFEIMDEARADTAQRLLRELDSIAEVEYGMDLESVLLNNNRSETSKSRIINIKNEYRIE